MADSKDTPVYCTCAMSQRCTALYRGLPTAKTKAKINQNTLFSSIVKHSIACKSDTISQELFCGACCDKDGARRGNGLVDPLDLENDYRPHWFKERSYLLDSQYSTIIVPIVQQ